MAPTPGLGTESNSITPESTNDDTRPGHSHDIEKGTPTVTAVSPAVERIEYDPNVVDWDGPDDPAKPINWPSTKKWKNVFVVSSLTLLTPFASSMFAPAVPQVMRDFKSDNIPLAAFVVSVYVLGYAFGPLIIGPLSELYGRLWVYHVNTALFVIFNLACGFAQDLNTEIVLRFFAGFAGVAPMTVGSGTIADLFRQEERGKVMSAWTLPILLGPTLGPVAGSYIAQALGWRWDFYTLSIAAAVMFTIALFLQDETYAITLLQRKAKKLRKETGNEKLKSALQPSQSPRAMFLLSIVRPTKMLFLSPIIFGLSLYIAVCYGYMYLVFTTITELFEVQYGISDANVGLTFLGIGVGQFLGLFVFAGISDRTLKSMAKKNGGEMKPEYRLPPLLWGGIVMPVGLLLYGWSAQERVHWIAPIIGTTVIGMAMILIFMPIGTYLVDSYTRYAASAMAANTVLRSIGGAVLPLCGPKMFHALGYGWGNTLLAGIAILCLPIVLVFLKYGERIRTHPKFQLNL